MKLRPSAPVINSQERKRRSTKSSPVRGSTQNVSTDVSYLDVDLHVWIYMTPINSNARRFARWEIPVRFTSFRDVHDRDEWFSKMNRHLNEDYLKCRALANVVIVRMQKAMPDGHVSQIPFIVTRTDTYPAFHESIDNEVILPIIDFIEGLLRLNSL